MKHPFTKAFVIVCCFQLLMPFSNWGQTPSCFTIQNFSSVCVQTSQPRKFTLNFKIVANYTGTSAILAPLILGSSFNNQPSGITVPLINNQANISINYTEGMMLSPIVKFTIGLKNNNNVVCQTITEQILVPCGNYPCLYVASSTQPVVRFDVGSLANYSGPTFTIHSGINAEPKKVSKITTTINAAQRRTKCLNTTPLPWQNVTLTPLTAQQLSLPSAQLTTNSNSVTKNHNPAFSYQTSQDYAPVFAAPLTKLNPNCPEEYTITISITILFEDGCSKILNYTLTTLRP